MDKLTKFVTMETKQSQPTTGELRIEKSVSRNEIRIVEELFDTTFGDRNLCSIKYSDNPIGIELSEKQAEQKAQRIVNAVNMHNELMKENNELKEWKKQQIEITSPILDYMRNNAEKFNLKLGESIFKRVLELIKKSKHK